MCVAVCRTFGSVVDNSVDSRPDGVVHDHRAAPAETVRADRAERFAGPAGHAPMRGGELGSVRPPSGSRTGLG